MGKFKVDDLVLCEDNTRGAISDVLPGEGVDGEDAYSVYVETTTGDRRSRSERDLRPAPIIDSLARENDLALRLREAQNALVNFAVAIQLHMNGDEQNFDVLERELIEECGLQRAVQDELVLRLHGPACTCDAGGSAGCPKHDSAVEYRSDDDPAAPLVECGGQVD